MDGVTHMYSSQFINVGKILTKMIDSLNALFYTTTNQTVQQLSPGNLPKSLYYEQLGTLPLPV